MTAEPISSGQRFARVLLSGEVGISLLNRLNAEFAAISRADAFFGCVLALSELHAGLVASEYELRLARRQIQEAA